MELTKQERRIAESAAKTYRGLIYRKRGLIGSIGLALFIPGLLPIFALPKWGRGLLLWAGFILITWGAVGLFLSVIGKLYERNKELEVELRKPDAKL